MTDSNFALLGAAADSVLNKVSAGTCARLLSEHPGMDCGVVIAAYILNQFGFIVAGIFLLFAIAVSVIDR